MQIIARNIISHCTGKKEREEEKSDKKLLSWERELLRLCIYDLFWKFSNMKTNVDIRITRGILHKVIFVWMF